MDKSRERVRVIVQAIRSRMPSGSHFLTEDAAINAINTLYKTDREKWLPNQYELMDIIEEKSKLDMDYHGIVCQKLAKAISKRIRGD